MKGLLIIIISTLLFSACGQDRGVRIVEISYPNGQIKVRGTTLNGKKHDVSWTYYENGQVQTENYWNKGVQFGKTTHWFENGVMKFEGQIKEGYESGEWKYYDKRDGKYIYSVFYEKGEVVEYKCINEKYRWRNIKIDNFMVSIDFPSFLMDSIKVPNIFDGYWTMFPWVKKSDIEFYSVAKTPLTISKNDFENSMLNLSVKQKDFLNILYHNAVTDPTVPNFNIDNYEIVLSEKITIDNNDAYKLDIRFTDYKVDLKSVLIPIQNDLYIISAFFNSSVDESIREKYFDSIVIIE